MTTSLTTSAFHSRECLCAIPDHFLAFRVDLDIVGSSNSLLETTTSQEAVHQPWFDPIPGEDDDEWGSTVIQQKITRRIIETEDDSKLKYPVNFQGGYAIVNQEEQNRWGRPRGYAILAGYNPIHNVSCGSLVFSFSN